MASSHVVGTQASSREDFDVKSFVDKTHDFGRAYRHRAIELIKFCQRFLASPEQSFHQYVALSSVLEKCDMAIASAAASRKRGSQEESDHYFEMAIRSLDNYALSFHLHEMVGAVMENARQMDLQNMNRPRGGTGDHAMPVVEFRILKHLPDEHPTIVLQALSSNTGPSVLPEIIWNFSHFEGEQRLTLAQNPHFYGDLPTSPTEYVAGFSRQPVEIYEGTIYVLTNNSRRVFLEIDENLRVFDNVWTTNNSLIFKEVSGRIEGETIVRGAVRDAPLFWYSMEPTQDQPEVTGTTTDWIDLIRNLGDSTYTNLRISDKQSFERTPSVPTGVASESIGIPLIDAVNPATITSVRLGAPPSEPDEQIQVVPSSREIRDSLTSLKAIPASTERISYFSSMTDTLIEVLTTQDDLKNHIKMSADTEVKVRKSATLVDKVVRKYEVDGLVEDDLSPDVQRIFQSLKTELHSFKDALRKPIIGKGEHRVEKKGRRISDLLQHFQARLAFDPLFSRCAEGIEVEVTDVDVHYDDDQTPLHVASQLGQHSVIDSLIRRGADPNKVNAFRETPLSLASRNGNIEVASALLSNGAQVDHMDSERRTSLHEASESGQDAIVRLLFEHQANLNLNAKNVHEWTALHLASRTGNLQVVQTLLGHDAEVNVVNKSLWTPLHLASQEGHVEVVESLLVGGAGVDERNADGETALHLAAYYGWVGVVEVLIRHHADRHVRNKKQKTALDLAEVKNHQDVRELLEQEGGIGGE